MKTPVATGICNKTPNQYRHGTTRFPHPLSLLFLCTSLIVFTLTGTIHSKAASRKKTTALIINEPEFTDRELNHWAFRPIQRIEPPPVLNGQQVQNPIDRFILKRLEKLGLSLIPSADRRTLIRRLSFDLRGLPPTLEEIQRYLKDDSPTAWNNLIERFLSSPAYGERWAQHWLDVARFAESDGFEHDHVRPEAWRYRDWVINALNRDLPYDDFIRFQLAGDEIDPGNPTAAIATGFLVAGPDMPDINLLEERRHTVLNEITATTGVVFMGMGLGCAQCHDHKYDPVSQADFYRMRSFFSNISFPSKNKQLGHIFPESRRVAPPSYLMILGDFRRKGPEISPAFLPIANRYDMTVSIPITESTTSGRRSALAEWLTNPDHPLTSRVIVNRLWQHHFGRPLVGTPNDFGLQGEKPSHPDLLDWLASELMSMDWSLKAMHRTMLQSATYRQASLPVNIQWRHATQIDPENRLWSRMKRKRLEGETLRDAMLAVSDQLNFEHGGQGVRPPLPEEITTTLLKKQWQVSTDIKDHFRRSIFLFVRRNLKYPMFDVFDRPDTNASCGHRSTSTTATQSLTLLNSDFSIQTARFLAGSVTAHGVADIPHWIDQCYKRVFSRPPTNSELQAGVEFIRQQSSLLRKENRPMINLATPLPRHPAVDGYIGTALTDFALAMFNLNEMIYLD
ncbi:MAG TPA: DUF1553 domain-containing protein [Verrucomicrobiales bacterium]|nr:DUF1553 domain-containing protein [Verrucomicrobiales bacterium]